MTPEERDEIRLTTASMILAALAPQGFAKLLEISDTADASTIDLATEAAATMSVMRATYALQEAETLLAVVADKLEAQTFDDGTPIDPRALDPRKRFCAHGVSMADDCATCAAGGIEVVEGDSDGAALAAFNAGLHSGQKS